jgi:hypothetical protein
MEKGAKIQPAKRVAGKKQDVWYVAGLILFLYGQLSTVVISVSDWGSCP